MLVWQEYCNEQIACPEDERFLGLYVLRIRQKHTASLLGWYIFTRQCRLNFRHAEILLTVICRHLPWLSRRCLLVHFTILICYFVFNNFGRAVKKVNENRRPQPGFSIPQMLRVSSLMKCICFLNHNMHCVIYCGLPCYQNLTRI